MTTAIIAQDFDSGRTSCKKSLLRHVELTKQEIRDLSKEMGLPTWDKQSFACLSSRFVYGEEITESKLSMVDQAEQLLLDMGFHQLRVRIHGQMARIEVMPSEFLKLMEDANREKIVSEFKKIGFSYDPRSSRDTAWEA